jgi:hypothetical protein
VALLVDARDQPRSQVRLRGVVGAEDRPDRRVFDSLGVESQDHIAAVVDADLAYAGVVPQVKTVLGKQTADLDLRTDRTLGVVTAHRGDLDRHDVSGELLGHVAVVYAHPATELAHGDAGVADPVHIQRALLGHHQPPLGVARQLSGGDRLRLEELLDLCGRAGLHFL